MVRTTSYTLIKGRPEPTVRGEPRHFLLKEMMKNDGREYGFRKKLV